MPLQPHLLKPRLPQHPPSCPFLPPKTAKEPHEPTPLPWSEALEQRVCARVVGERRRRAEWDGRVGEDERGRAALAAGGVERAC